VVGEEIQSAKLSRFQTFENVNDLRSNDELYSEVTAGQERDDTGRTDRFV
jgi:hypothetical protein